MRGFFTARPSEILHPSDRIHNSFWIPNVAKQREGLWWDWAETETATCGRPDLVSGYSSTTSAQADKPTNIIVHDRCEC